MANLLDPAHLSESLAAGAVLVLAFHRALRWGIFRSRWPQLQDSNAWIVDVRSSAEYLASSGEPGTHIPLERLEEKTEGLDKNTPIVLCCKSGERSEAGMEILRRKGFRNVANAGPCKKVRGGPLGLW